MKNQASSRKGIKAFEELRVFQSRKLCNGLWTLTRSGPASKDFALTNQARRAALSIMSNIAEGFERNSRKEFCQFLSIAQRSCGELRAQLLLAFDLRYLSEADHERIQIACLELSRGIASLMFYLRRHPKSPR